MTLKRFVLGADVEPERVDKLLVRLCEGTSRATLQRWIGEGRVLMDGRQCRAKDVARAGSVLSVEPGDVPGSDAQPDPAVAFEVLHEDDDLLIVNKPAGVVVHPARGHLHGTLVNGLLARPAFQRAPVDPRDPMGSIRPGIVHRIDKGTSGVLVIAKNEPAREGLKAQLAAHSVERVYRAITIGVPRPGAIRTTYGRDPRSRLRFTTRVREGKHAVTHVAVVERLASDRAAVVECRLETGRTHQIRVHLLEERGTPLLGDPLYRKAGLAPDLAPIGTALGHQALHAAVLGFQHPRTGEHQRFEAPLPADFQRALAAIASLSPSSRG